MSRRVLCVLAAALLVGCANADAYRGQEATSSLHFDQAGLGSLGLRSVPPAPPLQDPMDPTGASSGDTWHSKACFPGACELDYAECDVQSDGCSLYCSTECGFTQVADEPRQAPTGPAFFTNEKGEQIPVDCRGCQVTCGTPTDCPAGFVFHACIEDDQSKCASPTPKACRTVAQWSPRNGGTCGGCCLKSSSADADATATPTPAAPTPAKTGLSGGPKGAPITWSLVWVLVLAAHCLAP